ncbi:SRPBCC family protein [Streptomyces sp. A3M-1-3]|uniref:SRPBCC family protein n=1 Tax=Streptomyces sp. A3M-1-3 TaxID=2962044 RepID=UPI0020B74BAB|nr:SRPBCC family protein [Streptomyces sp. A3M-1-3]MCP3818518.1 SRPBCC family protein [Streptomyces sp. A3M-1-3]
MTGRRAARAAAWTASAAAVALGGYAGLVSGALPVDLGVGRRMRRLGPLTVDIAAPREVVSDVIALPYLGRTTRAMREKVRVLERGSDMVLAAHYTPLGGRWKAVTVETVRFTRPERVDFRPVRGPVPHVVESFTLAEEAAGTRLVYEGELGTDLWRAGAWWGAKVAARWEATVTASLATVKQEAERRAGRPLRG